MLPIEWKKQAQNDREKIFNFVAKESAVSAILLDDEIEEAPEHAQTHPRMHRTGRKQGTREIVVRESWIIVYCIEPKKLVILRVLSSRKKYP
ncbi:type II toxin-antitoxin system RelE/ParE family toxin [Klebsiella aerogenes]|nr:type II toxin-antitoxin system RelE/ParE family toxin [Klebsiella pneumoniae]EIW8510952.1 type II toxin-antitoxin system RelE/ParE family toxin [Klebsiella pneumoniae]